MQDKPRPKSDRPIGISVLSSAAGVEVDVDLLVWDKNVPKPHRTALVQVKAPTSSEAAAIAIREVDALASEARWAVRSVFGPLVPAEAPVQPFASALAEREVRQLSAIAPAELLQRITRARTPSIATEDALTVAKLHDLVIEFVCAADALEAEGGPVRCSRPARERYNKATVALRTVAGIE